jgi:predicted metalloendopeptidase
MSLAANPLSTAFAQETPSMPQIGTFGFDEKGMDRSVKPGDDFFAYANGTWIKNTPIPADKPAYGSKSRDEYLRQTMLKWRHSPDMQRVWTVRNIDAWYEAFNVRPGDKLYLPPEKRVRVW